MISVAEIKKYGAKNGIDITRVTSAEPFTEYVRNVRQRIKNGLIPTESQEAEDIFKRAEFYSDPKNSLPEAKSIISLGMRYLIKGVADHTSPGNPCGRIGRHLWRDFYGELSRKRARIVSFMEKKGIRCSRATYLPNKLVAERAGIGSYGKNCVIQNENYGSWIILASIVTDAPLKADNQSSRTCGSCEVCVQACPTHAIVAPYELNVGRCINHVLASSNPIPLELRPFIGNRIDSCDCCQEACPNNRKVKPVRKTFPNQREKWGTSPSLIPLLSVSTEEFKRSFSDFEFYKPELKFLQRNATVAMGNIGDSASLPVLGKMLRNKEPIVRAHASWAIGKIDGSRSKRLLLDALRKEEEASVKQEIENALRT